ncbi:MAG: 1-phosphofructokinase [Ruminococcaceae bacterium]|nr:1-phosphofructokinase [Oscillospiraceae bacterium]
MIYTVTMNPAIDCSMSVGSIDTGRVNRALSENIRFGGKGINVSYALKNFGHASILTGFVAGFTGDALTAGLSAEGFTCDFVRLTRGDTRINVKLESHGDDGDPDTEINAPGPTPTADEFLILTSKLSSLSAGDAVVIAGSMPCGVPADFIRKIAKSLPDGASLICDLSGDALKEAVHLSPTLVKPNIHELYELSGVPQTKENIKDKSLVKRCADKLTETGVKNVLVTMGEDGAYYTSSTGEWGFIEPPKAPESISDGCSAVGCGDSAVAGWLIGMGITGNTELSFDGVKRTPGRRTAAELAVLFGSASYYFGFPPSPEKLQSLSCGS